MDLINGNSTEGNNIALWTYSEGNVNQIFGIEIQPPFSAVDIGTNFYGSIVNLATNKPIKTSSGNVVCGIKNGSDEQKWYFERQEDNSYKITNVANGGCLDDGDFGASDNSNISTCVSNDSTAQRWYFRRYGSGYSLVPKCATNLAMDLVSGNPTEGSNVAAWSYDEGNTHQIFVIDKTVHNDIILGDVDGDGRVTILDATAIQRHLASLSTTAYDEKAADADEDGKVTILDATAIQRHLASLPTNERIGTLI